MKNTYNSPFIQDADLRLEGSLPNAAGGSVVLAYLDLGTYAAPNSGTREFLGSVDCWFDGVPPSAAPDGAIFTLSIEAADDPTFVAPRVLATATFTASGGAGLGEQHVRAALSADCPQYLRFRATSGGAAADASAYLFTGALMCPAMA